MDVADWSVNVKIHIIKSSTLATWKVIFHGSTCTALLENELSEWIWVHFIFPTLSSTNLDCVKSNLRLSKYKKCSSSYKVPVTSLRLLQPGRCIKVRARITQLSHTSAPALSAMATIILSIISPWLAPMCPRNIFCNYSTGYALHCSEWLTCTHLPCGLRSIRSVSNEASVFQQ